MRHRDISLRSKADTEGRGPDAARVLGLLATAVTFLLPAVVRAAAGDAARVSLTNCLPSPSNGALGPGTDERGYGNTPADRRFVAELVYHHDGPDIQAAAAKIQRIELCWVDPGGQGHCPGAGSWLVFDRSAGIGAISPSKIAPCTDIIDARPGGQALDAKIARCPEAGRFVNSIPLTVIPGAFDWGEPATAGTALIVRVTTVPEAPHPASLSVAETLAQANEHGICPNYSVRASLVQTGPMLRVVSATPDLNPFPPGASGGPQLDLCRGARLLFSDDLNADLACIRDDQAEYVRKVTRAIAVHQDGRLQAQLDPTPEGGTPPGPNQVHPSWRNGTIPESGQPVPANIAVINAGFVANPGTGFIGRGTVLGIDPVNDTPATILLDNPPGFVRPFGSGAPFAVIALPAHEQLHMLQLRWVVDSGPPDSPARNRMGALIFGARYFTESQAQSVDFSSCLFSYPNASSPTECVSWAKMSKTLRNSVGTVIRRGSDGGTFYAAGDIILNRPEQDTVSRPYDSSFFWHYVYQQFSYLVDQLNPVAVHPRGTDSLIPRESAAKDMALVDRLDSDQGYDFVGLLFRQFANTPDMRGTFDATDDALRTHLGRNFRDVILDFHTAMFLKEYSDVDPRWGLDWAHEDGFTATSTPASLKPIPVPTDLYGKSRDGYNRARRVLDRGQNVLATCPPAGGCVPAPVPLEVGQSQGAVDIFLGAYGTAAFSVIPTSGWAGLNMAVTARSLAGIPRFRSFVSTGTRACPRRCADSRRSTLACRRRWPTSLRGEPR
jgi:hypothetical protein